MSLLLDIPAHDAQRRAAAKQNGDPEVPVHDVPIYSAREIRSQPPERHALEGVH
jgi:hypothetical protein